MKWIVKEYTAKSNELLQEDRKYLIKDNKYIKILLNYHISFAYGHTYFVNVYLLETYY